MGNEYDSLPDEFRARLEMARADVAAARIGDDKLALANALKHLGGIERRPRFLRDVANETYAEASKLYRELEMPLEAAWVIRHIGINHEYAERLADAETCYDESLALFREHAEPNSPDYANTVRYPAVKKNRLGKREESTHLWEEAARRYDEIGLPVGVAEAAAWLTIFAIEKGDIFSAREWFAKAEQAALSAADPATDKFIADVRTRLRAETDE